MEPVLVCITDAAKMLGIGRTKTYQLIDENLLDTVSIGSRRLVKLASVKRLVGEAAENGEA